MTTSRGSSVERMAGTVNRHLTRKLSGSPDELYAAASHLIAHGGKRLRPYMVTKSCQILGGKVSDAINAAASVEMVHNFTLVHDDIMDNDEMRHGVMTVHKKFGSPVAILAGDVLFSKAYQILVSSSCNAKDAKRIPEMVSRLATACVDVCEGQMLDIKMAESKKIPTQKEYITMIKKKTAALFGVSCALGAICAGGRPADVARLSGFGNNLGIAFQITDDLIGVTGDTAITKKPVGNDIREGKKSLPILMALEAAKGTKHRKIISGAFGNPRVSKRDLDRAVDSVRVLGIEEETRKIAHRYAKKADAMLGSYPKAKARDDMLDLLGFVVKRSR